MTPKTRLNWNTPGALLREVDTEMFPIDAERLFNDPKYKILGEKWCAAKFGVGYSEFFSPCEIAINSEQDSHMDFFVRTSGHEYAFQLVEALEPGRLRGNEYKQFAAGTITSLPYEPERGHVEGAQWIAEQIGKKAAMKYSGSDRLNILVYANFSARELKFRNVVEAVAKYQKSFASIWVVDEVSLASIFVANDLGYIEGWAMFSQV